MDSFQKYVVPIAMAHKYPVGKVGGKSRNISLCQQSCFLVPQGFALTTDSYFEFVKKNLLSEAIDAELVRKRLDEMRWEEIWDASLRIRHAFAKGNLPEFLEAEILDALSQWPADTLFAVRSSSPDEDSKDFSFAGIHDSYINIKGSHQAVEKIKLVWASLWSDRALLYRKERGLNSSTSAMAVLVQRMEHRAISGLAFTADPVTQNSDFVVVETIRGSLDLLVDNKKAPERFKIYKHTGEVSNYGKILTKKEVDVLFGKIMELEKIFGEPIDIEWTGAEELLLFFK